MSTVCSRGGGSGVVCGEGIIPEDGEDGSSTSYLVVVVDFGERLLGESAESRQTHKCKCKCKFVESWSCPEQSLEPWRRKWE